MSMNLVYHERKKFEPLTVEQLHQALDQQNCKPRRDQDGYRAICPAHSGADGHNLTVHPKEGGGVVIRCHSHECEYQSILESLDLWQEPESTSSSDNGSSSSDYQTEPISSSWYTEGTSTVYQYQDEQGTNLYQNVRKDGKQFRARQFDQDGNATWNLSGIDQVPYGLPELVSRHRLHIVGHICEGEKDTITLRDNGFLATSLSAGALTDANLKYLKNRHIVIHEDNDDTGRKKTAKLIEWLDGTAASIRTMQYTDLPEKGDVTDWWNQGHTAAEFIQAIEALPKHESKVSAPEWEVPDPLQPMHGPKIDPGILPNDFRAYCEALAASLQVPLEMAVTNALGAISTAVTGRYIVKYRYPEPVHGMFVNVARPGLRKSPLMAKAAGAIYQWQKEQQEQDALAIAEWESANRALVKARDRLEGEPRKGEVHGEDRDLLRRAAVQELHDHDLKKPIMTWVIVDDATPQAVAWQLIEQPGVSVVSAESAYLENFYRYGDTPDFNAFLSGHAGEPISVHRRSGQSATTDRACLSLCISIQPDSLKAMGGVDGFMERGGTARLLMTIPEDIVGTRLTGPDVPTMPDELSAWWESLMYRLLEGRSTSTTAAALLMTPEATAAQDAFWAAVEDRQYGIDIDDAMRGWRLKQVGTALRLAGLLHLISHEPTEPISAVTMQQAIDLSEWYREHVIVAFSLMDNTGDDQAKTVWQALSAIGGLCVSRRDLHERLRGRKAFKRTSDLDGPLGTLEEFGHIRIRKETTEKGGRPVEWIDLNPLAVKKEKAAPVVRFTSKPTEDLQPTGTEGIRIVGEAI